MCISWMYGKLANHTKEQEERLKKIMEAAAQKNKNSSQQALNITEAFH